MKKSFRIATFTRLKIATVLAKAHICLSTTRARDLRYQALGQLSCNRKWRGPGNEATYVVVPGRTPIEGEVGLCSCLPILCFIGCEGSHSLHYCHTVTAPAMRQLLCQNVPVH